MSDRTDDPRFVAIERRLTAGGAHPQVALAALASLTADAADRDRLAEALREIESFPISGYHAGAAQRIAAAALAGREGSDDADCTCRPFHGAKNCPVHGVKREGGSEYALAAAQQPPHCTCQSSWPSDLRCPACEAAAQQPPADETKLSKGVQGGIRIIREQGCCGCVSADGSEVCIKEIGHTDAHGWQQPPAEEPA